MKNIGIKDSLASIGNLNYCEQCGRCSSACPITGKNDFNIRQIIRYVEISQIDQLIENLIPYLCLLCGRCEEACPNNIDILGLIRIIRSYIPNKLIPLTPCIEACPSKINIPSFLRMVAKGEEDKALELILQKVPIPGILGRVCGKPCESKCRRGQIDSPVSICNLKRYVSSLENTNNIIKKMYTPGEETGKKVLIFGSGPAGLTAAYYLRRKGYSVTILEERREAGGMLRYGIPNYRLPKHVVKTEIERITKMGVVLETNTRVVDFFNGKNIKENFDAFFIATGLQSNRILFKNHNFIDGITYGLDFLVKANSDYLKKICGKVLVLGGGNVAIDAARSALRLGASSVILVCLEDRKNMLADQLEVKIAVDEGIEIINSYGINRFLGNNTLTGVELVNCESIFDKNDNFNPRFGKEIITLDADHMIIAIGQVSNNKSVRKILYFLNDNKNILSYEDTLVVDSENKISGSKNIFAGGDIVGKSSSVIGAVASGHNVAISIDRLLGKNMGSSLDENDLIEDILVDFDISKVIKNSETSYIKRQKATILPKNERIKCFSEINCGLSQDQSRIEASRCLCCDLEYRMACSS